jgi:hypothetical protein
MQSRRLVLSLLFALVGALGVSAQEEKTRLQPPNSSDLEAAREQVRKEFPACGRSVSREKACKQVERFLEVALESAGVPSLKYALLDYAVQAAGHSGDPRQVLAAMESLVATFEVDGLRMSLNAMQRATVRAERAQDQRDGFEQLLKIADQAIECSRLPLSAEAIKAAHGFAKKIKLDRFPGKLRFS